MNMLLHSYFRNNLHYMNRKVDAPELYSIVGLTIEDVVNGLIDAYRPDEFYQVEHWLNEYDIRLYLNEYDKLYYLG